MARHTLPNLSLNASNAEGFLGPSHSSLSSGSSNTATSNGVSQVSSSLFDNVANLSITTHGSYDTNSSLITGFPYLRGDEATVVQGTTSNVSRQSIFDGHHAHARPSGNRNQAQSLSQLWTSQEIQSNQSTLMGPATPLHLRFGSLDAHSDQRGLLSNPVACTSTQHVPSTPRRLQNSDMNDAAAHYFVGCTHSMHISPNSDFLLGPNCRLGQDASTPVQASNCAPASFPGFPIKKMQNSLNSVAISEPDKQITTPTQNLGIDILRLSPKIFPIRQPIPAPPLPVVPVKEIQSGPLHHGFMPMQAVMQQKPQEFICGDIPAIQTTTSSTKFSIRYHGMHTDTNASAEYLPVEQNCALWLTNLPPNVTTHQLLSAIRNVGRIWCSYINYPDFVTHQTAAAKVVFFTPEGAQRLLGISWTKGLYLQGYRIKVSHNRIKYAGHAIVGKASRILIITGHADFVNEETLTKFFKHRFIFQVDEVLELIKAGDRAIIEYKFGSYRCQAQMGKMSLEKDRPAGLEKVEFGDDPCEVGDTLSSYGIAAERIQGRGL